MGRRPGCSGRPSGENVASGLRGRFGSRWPEPGQGRGCVVDSTAERRKTAGGSPARAMPGCLASACWRGLVAGGLGRRRHGRPIGAGWPSGIPGRAPSPRRSNSDNGGSGGTPRSCGRGAMPTAEQHSGSRQHGAARLTAPAPQWQQARASIRPSQAASGWRWRRRTSSPDSRQDSTGNEATRSDPERNGRPQPRPSTPAAGGVGQLPVVGQPTGRVGVGELEPRSSPAGGAPHRRLGGRSGQIGTWAPPGTSVENGPTPNRQVAGASSYPSTVTGSVGWPRSDSRNRAASGPMRGR